MQNITPGGFNLVRTKLNEKIMQLKMKTMKYEDSAIKPPIYK